MRRRLIKLLFTIASLLSVVFFSKASLTALAASKAKSDTESLINASTLSGGVIHNEGYFLPRGLIIPCELRTPIDSRLAQVGDIVTVQTMADLFVGDYNIIPAQSFLHGYISKFDGPGRFYKNPKVEITFDAVSMPGEHGRRDLFIQGKVNARQLVSKSKRVNDNTKPYKSRAKKASLVGAATGFSGGFAFTSLAAPYETFGISGLLTNLTLLGATATGAIIGAGLIERDDVRIESGTPLEIILEEPTLNLSALSKRNLKADPDPNHDEPQTPTETYDRFSELKSLEL